MKRALPITAAIASAAALTLPQAAGATTYCVAKPSCIAAGGTFAASVGDALNSAKAISPGPDRVEIGPGDFVSAAGFSYGAQAGNPVDIVGSGRGVTRLHDTGNGPIETTLKMVGAHESTVSDLSIYAPPASGSGPVWALVTSEKARRIQVTGGKAFIAVQMNQGSSIVDSSIQGSSEYGAVNATDATVSRTSIETPGDSLAANGVVRVSQSRIDARKGPAVSGNADLTVDNSQVVTHGFPGLTSDFGSNTKLHAVNDTIIGDGSDIGVFAGKGTQGHATHVTVQNTTISGFTEAIHVNQAGGAADVKVANSNFDPAKVVASAGQLDASQGNVNVDPHFVDPSSGDFHLQPGSPLIDAGSADGIADNDLDGAKRALDGNGDGSALPDIGAYESPAVPVKQPDPGPPAPPPAGPPPPTKPPVVAPAIKSLSFTHKSFRVVLSKNARVKITIKRRDGRALGSLSRSLRLGKSTIAFKGRLGRRSLKTGRYVAVAIATDKAGHSSKKRSLKFRW
jgi:hypothetical protein